MRVGEAGEAAGICGESSMGMPHAAAMQRWKHMCQLHNHIQGASFDGWTEQEIGCTIHGAAFRLLLATWPYGAPVTVLRLKPKFRDAQRIDRTSAAEISKGMSSSASGDLGDKERLWQSPL